MAKFDLDLRRVSFGEYEIKPPLIKPSKLTYQEKGGIGKELSDGWAVNFAIGCTHGCPFCYVDNIHKRFTLTSSPLWRFPSSIRSYISHLRGSREGQRPPPI